MLGGEPIQCSSLVGSKTNEGSPSSLWTNRTVRDLGHDLVQPSYYKQVDRLLPREVAQFIQFVQWVKVGLRPAAQSSDNHG